MMYFAYGSNLHIPRLRAWLTRGGVDADDLKINHRATLEGYRLRTNYLCSSGAGAANIEPGPRHAVEGLIMTITPAVRAVLRIKEGYPHRYAEIEIAVTPWGKKRKICAFTYIVAPECRTPRDLPVTQEYRRLILEGAASHGLSPAYQEYLRRVLRPLRNDRILRPQPHRLDQSARLRYSRHVE